MHYKYCQNFPFVVTSGMAIKNPITFIYILSAFQSYVFSYTVFFNLLIYSISCLHMKFKTQNIFFE